MEKFKAVEKEMKTKAFSKEGLNAPGKRDPKEQEKEEMGQFLSEMIGELERQIEAMEAEEEQLQATVKKGKKDPLKADRLGEITKKTEGHTFHIGKLELLRRSLENGNVDTDKVQEKKEEIEYYVMENSSVDFMDEGTEEIYDDLNLEEDEGVYGLANDNDKVSSQDAQSTADDLPEGIDRTAASSAGGKPKASSMSESQGTGVRRPSNAHKSPLPALATLHTPLPSVNTTVVKDSMKPAPLPTRPPGETLKYASAAAAAAAASDKPAAGIAPLPPPPSSAPAPQPAPTTSSAPSAPPGLSAPTSSQRSTPASPNAISFVPVNAMPGTTQMQPPAPQDVEQPPIKNKSPVLSSVAGAKATESNSPEAQATKEKSESSRGSSTLPSTIPTNQDRSTVAPSGGPVTADLSRPSPSQQMNGDGPETNEEESIYHLPPGLQDLIQSFEVTKSKAAAPDSSAVQRLLEASQRTRPEYLDAERPHHYRPDTRFATPSYYPQEPFNNIDDPGLYSKVDTDTLFYIFYYRQNTYQQYMAAKALKSQSWRFHKQYQTWFQRHEEPKTITEEFEQGTYRFFDYESTWYESSPSGSHINLHHHSHLLLPWTTKHPIR